MALLKFNNIGISGISAAVPKHIVDNYNYTSNFDKEIVKEIVDKIGIKERRFADSSTCSSDLCFAAAQQLIADMNIDKSEIDILIFVSQTPDYRMPATSILLQERLGLSKQTAAFDISLGCSAFIYGLSTLYAFMQTGGFKKGLLLDGETRSRIYSPKDRNTAFLFGDGGVAAIIECGEQFGESYFSLNSDGSKESLIKIKAGGYRNPSSLETLQEKVVDDYGNIRTEEHGSISGADVFNFVLLEIPKDINSILQFSKTKPSEIDFFVFHQANSFMNDYLTKKMKLDKDKVPASIEKFGNTSSVSIPLTIVTELKNKLKGDKKMLFSGFGVGMSWASALINTSNCFISELVEI